MGATVLFVEDNNDTRLVLTRLLKSCGWNVLDFADAEGALSGLPATGVDLALLDMRLPGMWGDELARRLRMMWPNIPVAFVTAEPLDAMDARLQDLGGCRVIHKPIQVDRLLNELADEVARGRG
jgi:CheY-like chemotaxis protein